MSVKTSPDEIMKERVLDKIEHDRWVRAEMHKGACCLNQAGMLANDMSNKQLRLEECCQTSTTPGLWRHEWWHVVLALVVDDFRVDHVVKEHVKHLTNTLHLHCDVSEDWAGENTSASIFNGIMPKE